MLKLSYLIVLGCAVGAITAAVCGHLMFWFPVGALLGLAWHRAGGGQAPAASVTAAAHRYEAPPIMLLTSRHDLLRQTSRRGEIAPFSLRQAA